MVQTKRKISIAKIVICLMLISFIIGSILPLFAELPASASDKNLSLHEKQQVLSELNRKKSSIATKLKEARLREAYASNKLVEIENKLNQAQASLKHNKEYLLANQDAWNKTKERLDEINAQKQSLEGEAKERIVAIYKQQRLKLIDGLLNSDSITDFMDHFYYQQKVINYDKQVLKALVDQSENIKKYNEVLAREAARIEEITKRLRNIEKEIAGQKDTQKKIVSKLQGEREVYEASERQLEKESLKLVYKISELSTGTKLDNPDATGTFAYPVKARITSPFGPRRHPIFGVRSLHSGIDLAAPRGTEIKASEGGLVIYAGWYGGYGKVVIIDHSKGYSTLYAHLDSVEVKVGNRVKQGQTVGYEGDTGYATGPHLHFEVRSKGRPENPMHFLET